MQVKKKMELIFVFSKGKHEDITREYFEAKKRYEGIMESLKNLKKYSKVTLLFFISMVVSSAVNLLMWCLEVK